MRTLAWARLIHRDKPTPAVFVFKRSAANTVLVAGPLVHPCACGCGRDTGSPDMFWASHTCSDRWHARAVG